MNAHRQNRRGNVAIAFLLSSPIMLGGVAMAVDMVRIRSAQSYVQSAVDDIVVAAASQIADPVAALSVANAYAALYTSFGAPVTITASDLEKGYWDGSSFDLASSEDDNAMKATATMDVPMFFAGMFGLNTVTVKASAGGSPNISGVKAPDIILALDVTGSMSASEIQSEKDAAKALLDCLNENSDQQSTVGITLFTGVDTRWESPGLLEDEYGNLSAAIDAIDNGGCGAAGMPACSATNPAAGLGSALGMHNEFGGSNDQAVVLLSDGEPITSSICNPAYYTGGGWAEDELPILCGAIAGQPTQIDYLNWAQNYQANAELADVDVYTVFYGEDAAGAAYLESNISAGDGFSLTAPTQAEMETAFEDICQSVVGSQPGLIF